MGSQNASRKACWSKPCECWVYKKKHEGRMNAEEMRALHSMFGVTLKDKMQNSVVRDMDIRRMSAQIYRANVIRNVGRGRSRRT